MKKENKAFTEKEIKAAEKLRMVIDRDSIAYSKMDWAEKTEYLTTLNILIEGTNKGLHSAIFRAGEICKWNEIRKEVEISDKEIAHYWKRKNCTGTYLEGLIDGSIWMRDKQGIAPNKEVEEKKWTDNDVNNFLNDYVNQLSIKLIKIKKPICSNTICESINEFLGGK